MLINSSKKAIGRTNALLVLKSQGRETAVVSHIIARIAQPPDNNTGCFEGICGFSEKTQEHIEKTISSIIKYISDQLHLSPATCRLSIGNIGATALHNIGFSISGYSSDAAVCLSALSSLLRLPIDQGIAVTGHISSLDAEIKAVKNIPAKIEAATASDTIHTIIIPNLYSDLSAMTLSPRETEKVKEAVLKAKSFIKVRLVNDLEELVREVFPEELIVQSSLKQGFFESPIVPVTSDTALVKTVKYFGQGNEKRFWQVLEGLFIKEKLDEAVDLIKTFLEYHISCAHYPRGFGSQLYKVILSMPPYIQRDITDAIIDKKNLYKLTRLIKERDVEDLHVLFTVSSNNFSACCTTTTIDDFLLSNGTINDLTNKIIAKISRDSLSKLTAKIDQARAVFVMNKISVKSIEEFNQAITAFFIYILRHTGKIIEPIDGQLASEEAFTLVERSFGSNGGYKFACKEAIDSQLGGLRYIYDTMTEQLKREEQEKYINYIFKTAVEPLSQSNKTELIKNIVNQFSDFLPVEIVNEPENYVNNYAEIFSAYIRAADQVKSVFKSL